MTPHIHPGKGLRASIRLPKVSDPPPNVKKPQTSGNEYAAPRCLSPAQGPAHCGVTVTAVKGQIFVFVFNLLDID